MSELVDNQQGEKLTDLIQQAANNAPDAKDKLYALIYDDLRVTARRVMRKQPQRDLHTTDLVNEVVLRFESKNAMARFANRRVLFSVAIRAMRQVLIDHYRRRTKLVDSPDRNAVPLDEVVLAIKQQIGYDVEQLDVAIASLEAEAPRQHAVLTYRVFGGLSIAETATLLEVSRQTVDRDWTLAKAKVFRFMKDES